MANKSKQINLLLNKAKQEEQDCIIELAKTKQRYTFACQKYNELLNYQNEYHKRLANMASDGIKGQQYSDFVRFMSNIDFALKEQLALIGKEKKNLDEANMRYIGAKQELEKYNMLLQKLQNTEQIYENKKNQKENDEHAQNQWYIRNKDRF